MPAPILYNPSPIPGLNPGESAEDYIKRLIPWMQTEFEAIKDQFDQMPIIPLAYEAPRAPFTGMMVLAGLSGGWNPGGSWGIYMYLEGWGWYRVSLAGPYS
jgi:hypothetical protein